MLPIVLSSTVGNRKLHCDVSLVVRIVAFQAVDPGSSPGRRNLFLFLTIISFKKDYFNFENNNANTEQGKGLTSNDSSLDFTSVIDEGNTLVSDSSSLDT